MPYTLNSSFPLHTQHLLNQFTKLDNLWAYNFQSTYHASDIPLLSLTCTSVGWITKFLQSQRTWKEVYSRPHSLGAALRSSGSLNSIMAKIQRMWLGTSFESLWIQSMPRSRTFTSMSKYCSISFDSAGVSHSARICWNVTQVTQILVKCWNHLKIWKSGSKTWKKIQRLTYCVYMYYVDNIYNSFYNGQSAGF